MFSACSGLCNLGISTALYPIQASLTEAGLIVGLALALSLSSSLTSALVPSLSSIVGWFAFKNFRHATHDWSDFLEQ